MPPILPNALVTPALICVQVPGFPGVVQKYRFVPAVAFVEKYICPALHAAGICADVPCPYAVCSHVFVEAQAYSRRFASPVERKKNSPCEHEAGSEAPDFNGFVLAAELASQAPRMDRLPLITVCPSRRAAPVRETSHGTRTACFIRLTFPFLVAAWREMPGTNILEWFPNVPRNESP